MALAESNMMKLGTIAPNFSLPDTVSGKTVTLNDMSSEVATVIFFICNHCPFVLHINQRLVEIAKMYQEKGVQFVAISSNNVATHPQDGPTLMKETALREGYSFPYLYDETQEVAKAYKAECTPDFFVFDKNSTCVYRGRFDETRPNKGTATGKDLTTVLDKIITGESININQHPSIGCNIKWK